MVMLCGASLVVPESSHVLPVLMAVNSKLFRMLSATALFTFNAQPFKSEGMVAKGKATDGAMVSTSTAVKVSELLPAASVMRTRILVCASSPLGN